MRLYRMLIRPQISYPDQHYNPVCQNLEQDGKWYAEEEKGAIKEKYKHLENTFEQVVFDVKYEPIDAIPVEWLREKIKEHTDEEGWQDYLANSFGLCIEAWQNEHEVTV